MMDLKTLNNIESKTLDLTIVSVLLLLLGMGMAAVMSSSVYQANKLTGDLQFFFKKQLIFVAIGLLLFILLSRVNGWIIRKLAKFGIFLSVFLLALLFIPVLGKTVNGATSWLQLGSVSFQPAEFVKILLVFYLAKALAMMEIGQPITWKELKNYLLWPGIVVILVLLQPDMGTAFHIGIIISLMLFASGFSFKFMLGILLTMMPFAYYYVVHLEKNWRRVQAFLDPFADPDAKGYQLVQSLVAFERGHIWGIGLGAGTQKRYRLPEPHTDFIYASTAEELGLIWSLSVILLFLILAVRCFFMVKKISDPFFKLSAIGLLSMVLSQALLNMGVVTGLLPVTGIPLPFISYGGSHILANLSAMGLFLAMARQSEIG